MDSTDRMRLIANGYHIYRVDMNQITITECTPQGGWKLHDRYASKAALHRAWKELHANPLSIGD